MANQQKKKFIDVKERERKKKKKKKVPVFSEHSLLSYRVHFKAKENEQEQRLTGS